jgi:MFS transporter, YNFM family, putative membrane transport protein
MRVTWRYRETVLALCTLAFFVTMVGRLAVSPVVPEISAEFDVSNALVGMAMTGMWLAYALSQYPSGMLADRYGERRVILVAVGGTGVLSLLLVFAPHFAVFFLGAVLVGGAAGLHYSVATTLLARIYDDNIGTAVGVHNVGAPAAGLLTPVVVAWIAARYGWRPAVAITVVVAVPCYLLFAARVRPTEPRRPAQPLRERIVPESARELLSRPAIVFTGAIAVVSDFIWQGIATFLPTFLIEHQGYSATTAAVLFGAYFVVQGFLQVAVGSLSDRIGRDGAITLCTVAGGFGLSLLILGTGFVAVTAGIVLLGLGMGWGAAVLPRFIDHLAPEERSVGIGLVRTVYMILASAGSVVVGFLADLFGWAVSFGVLVAMLAFVGCLLVANWATGSRY